MGTKNEGEDRREQQDVKGTSNESEGGNNGRKCDEKEIRHPSIYCFLIAEAEVGTQTRPRPEGITER